LAKFISLLCIFGEHHIIIFSILYPLELRLFSIESWHNHNYNQKKKDPAKHIPETKTEAHCPIKMTFLSQSMLLLFTATASLLLLLAEADAAIQNINTDTAGSSSTSTSTLSSSLQQEQQRQLRSSSSSSQASNQRELIIGGHNAEEGRYPYFVALQTAQNNTECGGTLIAPDVVLTAAHCAA
jgi:Trypsin